jgi:hypothetical protein
MADSKGKKQQTVGDSQVDALSVFGVPVVVSNYAPEDTIMLIGKRKRPYSPFPQSLQDELLGYWSDNELMGIIKLKPTSDDKDSWISTNHTLNSIRGREEALDELMKRLSQRLSEQPRASTEALKQAPKESPIKRKGE